jgi:hypothetical protein
LYITRNLSIFSTLSNLQVYNYSLYILIILFKSAASVVMSYISHLILVKSLFFLKLGHCYFFFLLFRKLTLNFIDFFFSTLFTFISLLLSLDLLFLLCFSSSLKYKIRLSYFFFM